MEFLFDLLIEFLTFLGFKKKKKGEKEFTSLEINDSSQKQNTPSEGTQQNISLCAGCHRTLEKDAIFELGKTWCSECYKTHVLKIKS